MKKIGRITSAATILLLCLLLFAPTASAADKAKERAAIEMPDAWSETVEQAPMTAEQFGRLSLADMAQYLWDAVKDHLLEPVRLFAKLCAVVILTATVKGLSGEGTQSEIVSLLDTVAALAVFTLCSAQILGLTNVMQTALEDSRAYMACFVPVFASVMVSCGQMGASLVYSGLFFTVAMLTAQIIGGVGLPLTRILLALHATSAVDSALDLSKLAKSLTKWIKWLLCVFATIFATVLGLQTALAQSADSAALKAGKFLIGSSVPVVGRAVSDAVGSVLAGMKLMKGTVGFAAVAVIGAAFLPVLLQCAAYHVVFTLGSIVAGATGNSKTEKLLEGCTQCVGLYLTMALIFGMMMVATTLVMVVTGTGS
ncbi:MAG: hypothetical protein RSD27_05965 [Ruthenibacterium sp.]